MPFANGVFTRVRTWTADFIAGIAIESALHDEHDEDIADALSNILRRDGLNEIRVSLDLGGNRIVNLADAIANTQAATWGQARIQSLVGTAGSLTATYADGTEEVLGTYDEGYISDPVWGTNGTDNLVFTKDGTGQINIDLSTASATKRNWTVQDGGGVGNPFAITAGSYSACDVSAATFTASLPSSITAGDEYALCVFSTSAVTPLTLDLNGHTALTPDSSSVTDDITIAPGQSALLVATGTGTSQTVVLIPGVV